MLVRLSEWGAWESPYADFWRRQNWQRVAFVSLGCTLNSLQKYDRIGWWGTRFDKDRSVSSNRHPLLRSLLVMLYIHFRHWSRPWICHSLQTGRRVCLHTFRIVVRWAWLARREGLRLISKLFSAWIPIQLLCSVTRDGSGCVCFALNNTILCITAC